MSEPSDGLIVHTREPYNAEPPLERLGTAMRTPQRDFYVRSHGAIPLLDPTRHVLAVRVRVARPLRLDLAALRQFPRHTVAAVLQCAGNRRRDMFRVRPVSGDPWAGGAIGNAEWAGVRLADVLLAAGVEAAEGLHVAFDALDDCEAEGCRFRYGVSIPIAKAMAPEVLLADAMNGEALTPEHGAPLRAIVPGYAGARSPKWLAAITVQAAPADGFIQAHEYKLFPPDVTQMTADSAKGLTINAMPLNSAICAPADDAKLSAGVTTLRGWAVASGREIVRVDVSADGGRNWTQAELEHDGAAPWSWTLWRAQLDLPKGEHELVVRGWDCAGQTQPALPDDTWNFKGYLAASWHRIHVRAA